MTFELYNVETHISLESIEVIGLVKRLYHAAETWQTNLEVGCGMFQKYGSWWVTNTPPAKRNMKPKVIEVWLR